MKHLIPSRAVWCRLKLHNFGAFLSKNTNSRKNEWTSDIQRFAMHNQYGRTQLDCVLPSLIMATRRPCRHSIQPSAPSSLFVALWLADTKKIVFSFYMATNCNLSLIHFGFEFICTLALHFGRPLNSIGL